MKKFFLIPLMTLVCSVMAWSTTYQVGTYAQLKAALEAGDATLIELTDNITYDGAWSTYNTDGLYDANAQLTGLEDALCIKNSLTLDGKGYQIVGFGKHNVSVTAASNLHRTTLAVHPESASAELDVTIKNLSLGNKSKNKRYYGIITFDGVKKLKCENVEIACNKYSYQQPLCFTGATNDKLELVVENSSFKSGASAYPAYILKPIEATLTNSLFEGYCALYFKYRATGVYGDVSGARGSVVNADACAFNAPNVHSGSSNAFAVFPMEDDGITLNLNNCSFNAEQIGDQWQSWVSVQYRTRADANQPIAIKITGDNTHMYNINKDKIIDIEDSWKNSVNDLAAETGITTSLTIEGGTFSLNPSTFVIEQGDGTVNAPFVDDTKYEINPVSQSGKNLFRVVKKADGTDINDNAGQNEDKTIEVATGGDVALAQETTEAGYVQVKNDGANATHVTVAKNNVDPSNSQTLIVNNGLDVLGTSTVTVQPTAALVVGEGGITTQSATNIVIEADEDGSASLLLHPAITVNQTPELTVKMKAHVGKISTNNYEWHRFAMPVDEISSLPSTAPTSTTAIFTWDHAAQGGQGDWVSISALSDLDPFKGYTLTVDYDGVTDYVYTFTGRLTGNINTDLQLTHQGYNFFGNSYTGYIKLATLADAIIGNADLDATVWAWDSEHQVYGSVSLRALQDAEDANYAHLIFPAWKREIAPMQTFILRLPNKDNATAEVDYASAIWGNPRYSGSTSSSAPARMAEIDGSIISMSISSENGSADNVLFMEKNAYSDDFENGYDAMKYMNENAVNMFVTVNGEDLSAVATDAIEGKMLTIQTGKAVNYTLTIDAALGAEYAIRDNVTNQVIAIEEGATYEFAAQPNSVIEGRFEIIDRANAPTAIENTEVKANVKGIYTIMGQYLGEDFDILPAGVYVVNGVKIVK